VFDNSGSPGSQTLLVAVDNLLKQCQIDKSELQGICLTLGPGSFTSMRICLSVAQAMGLAFNIPLYGIDELTLIADTVPFYPYPIKVIKNAYKGEFYTGTFVTTGGKATMVDRLTLVTPAHFHDRLQANDLVLGNGLEKLLAQDYDPVGKQAQWNNDFNRHVGGINVIEHFLDTEAQEPSEIPLEPIYIRLSEAELNYNKQFGISGEDSKST
jgi:tRNA threonylcarbamoyladenosine biosynthesis protein TsaB